MSFLTSMLRGSLLKPSAPMSFGVLQRMQYSTILGSASRPSMLSNAWAATILQSSPSPFVTPFHVRHVTYGNSYQPSNLVRKRRHGFLARMRSRTGRRVLAFRKLKGRKYLSH